jgi:hypothetical protein
MNTIGLAVFGWLVPGGAYLLMRRYVAFAVFAVVVVTAVVAGAALQGGLRWPAPEELAGLDGFTALVFRAAALGKALAGGPYLLVRMFGGSSTFLDSRMHEYGSTLLIMAGAVNVLAVSSALDQRSR